jgi:hypothetical protein
MEGAALGLAIMRQAVEPIKARSRPADFGAWLGRSLPLFAMALEQAPEVDADRAKALPKARVAQTEGPARPFGHRIAGLG